MRRITQIQRVGLRIFIFGTKQSLINHTAPPAALPAVVPPCGVWLIRPQSSRLAALHPAPYGGQGGGATHGPQAKTNLMVDLGNLTGPSTLKDLAEPV